MSIVMDADRIGRTLARIAHEIVERNKGVDDLALVGVRTRGVPHRPAAGARIKEITGDEVPTGALDITLYRDDLMRTRSGRSRSCGGPRSPSRSTTARFCWWTTCSTPAARPARRSTR